MFKGFKKKVKGLARIIVRGIFNREVDYTKTIENILVATEINYVDLEIRTHNFPKPEYRDGLVQTDFKILPNRNSSEKALAMMKEKQCRAPDIYEFLAVVGLTHTIPLIYRRRTIVALGATYTNDYGKKFAVVFAGNATHRDITLMPFDCKWPKHFRFLAVYTGQK